MPRIQRVVTITDQGRDKGKQFLLTEMPADQGEWWAARALSVMGNAGVKVGAAEGMSGMAAVEASQGAATALFAMGLKLFPGVDMDALKPLMDELMACVQYKPPGDARLPVQELHSGPLGQIEEITTRLRLRSELLELHLGFSLAGALSNLSALIAAPPAPASPDTSTFPPSSVP